MIAHLFSISDFMFRSDILCCHIKEHSYDAPSSPEDELQGASPHAFCLHNIENLIHDQGIYNNSTKFFTKKQYIQLNQVKNKDRVKIFI